MAKEDFRHKSEFRVRFGETDLQGIVFNANYLLYMDTAQMDYLRRMDDLYAQLRANGHDLFIVDARIQFKAPLYFDEVLEVFTRIHEIGNSSFKMDYEMFEQKNGRYVARGETVHVTVEEKNRTPVRVPPYMRTAVRSFEQNPSINPE
ncbi:MAG: thioesterase family protein [bacterium]|nr:thioesterase family protein [bacterium]